MGVRAALRVCDHFVSDGDQRHYAVLVPEISAAVREEFAERLASASWTARLWLRIVMRREIRQRIKAVVSPYAVY
jgi:hypothetical protein